MRRGPPHHLRGKKGLGGWVRDSRFNDAEKLAEDADA